jgi:hypothetical protein
MGAFEQQPLLAAPARAAMQLPHLGHQRITPTRNQGRYQELKAVINGACKAAAAGPASEGPVAAHMDLPMENQLLTLKIHPIHGGHLAVQTLGSQVFDQLANHNVFNRGLVEAIGRQAFNKLSNLRGEKFGRIGNLENNHD